MVTLETLQVINASLDEERDERVNEATRKTLTSSIEEQGEEEASPKVDPECTEHMKVTKQIIAYFTILGKPVGIKYQFDHCYWKEPGFYVAIFFKSYAWLAIIQTVYVHGKNGDYVRILEPITIAGAGASCCMKMYGILANANEIVGLLFYFRTLCRRVPEGTIQANVLLSDLRGILAYFKTFIICVFISLAIGCIVPIKMYLIDKELVTLMPIEMLFCDQSTMKGFILANILEMTMGFNFALFIITFASTFIVFLFNYITTFNLLAEDFEDLDKMWNGEIELSVSYRHAFLLNICRKRQDMNRYLDRVKKIYSSLVLKFFCLYYFSQIVCLFLITQNNWQSGYGLLAGISLEMTFYCIMGTQITISSDRLCAIIYGTKWYEYDARSQKMILLLLMEAQMPRDLQLGFMGPLNMVTYVKIVKSVYSYYTVLTEVL